MAAPMDGKSRMRTAYPNAAPVRHGHHPTALRTRPVPARQARGRWRGGLLCIPWLPWPPCMAGICACTGTCSSSLLSAPWAFLNIRVTRHGAALTRGRLQVHQHDVVATGLELHRLACGKVQAGDGAHFHHVAFHLHFVHFPVTPAAGVAAPTRRVASLAVRRMKAPVAFWPCTLAHPGTIHGDGGCRLGLGPDPRPKRQRRGEEVMQGKFMVFSKSRHCHGGQKIQAKIDSSALSSKR